MVTWLTVSEVAERWNIPKQQVTRYCRDGRIDGAQKDGHTWMIPADAKKPENLRRGRKSKTPVQTTVRLPLPIGVSDFRVACDEYYYIDKTLLIKDFIDERPIVSLFTRPRRFGKILTMDMLRVSPYGIRLHGLQRKLWMTERFRFCLIPDTKETRNATNPGIIPMIQ